MSAPAAVVSPRVAFDLFAELQVLERPYLVEVPPLGDTEEPEPESDDATGIGFLDFAQRLYEWFRPARHHRLIAERLEAMERGEIDRLIIVMPPGHGKSTMCSELFPAWYLGRNPDRRVINTSYSGDLAYRFSGRVRDLFAFPGWPFPDVRVSAKRSAVDRWDVAGRFGGARAAGVGGGIVGYHADLFLLDDPFESAADAASLAKREAVWEWWRGTAYHRLKSRGAAVIVSTRWHHDDLVGRLIAEQATGGDRWEVLHLPAFDDQRRALWPEMYDEAELARRERNMGPRLFGALYQGAPTSDEGALLKRHLWRYWHHPNVALPPVPTPLPNGDVALCPCIPLPARFDQEAQSWDMSFANTATASFVVGQLWARRGATCYVLDQIRNRMEFTQAIAAVKALTAIRPRALAKWVENKANGPAVISQLRNEIPGLIAVEPQGSKESRVIAIQPAQEAGNIVLPHPSIAPWVPAFVQECVDFPAGANDDQVDALTQAVLKMLGRSDARETRVGNYLGRPGSEGEDDD